MQLMICSPGHENINVICPGTIGIVLQIWPIDTEKGKITEIRKYGKTIPDAMEKLPTVDPIQSAMTRPHMHGWR
jgi:hypothetical protein